LQTRRHFVAYEKNARYAKLAEKRIREFSSLGRKRGMKGED
jgi:hypothetical protein